MVFSEVCTLRVEDQRVATVTIGFGEGPINGDRLARVFEGPLGLFHHHWHVTVANHPGSRMDAKLCQDFLAEGWRVDEREVWIFLFLMGGLIGNEMGLEGGHLVFAK